MAEQAQYQLNDKFLIQWFKENYGDIAFIAKLPYEIRGRTERLIARIKELDDNQDLFRQPDKVAEIWRDLVGKAIVYLKSCDAREKYHDDEDYGVEKLDEFFRTFRQFEPLLYGAQEERYRDHMAHMFTVFLVGEVLIRNTIGFEKINVGDADLPPEKKVSRDEKEAMWCIMALTHDLGIALEKTADISPRVKDMLEKFGIISIQELSYPFLRQPVHDFVIQFISSELQLFADGREKLFIPHTQSKYFLKFSEAYERRDHGIISCLVLMKNLVYFLETDYSLDEFEPLKLDDARHFLIRSNILRSIAAHNNENVYYLTLPQFPFLLTLFDELHEWGRPKLAEVLFERERLETIVTVKDLRETTIHYEFALSPMGTLKSVQKNRMKREICKYFIGKCEKIRRILRSAVGGEDRNLTLTFEVVDQLEAKAKGYKIIHETPQNVKILVNGKEISWLKLQAEAQR